MILFPIIYNLTHNSNFLPDIEEYFGKIAIKPPDTLFHIQQGIRGFCLFQRLYGGHPVHRAISVYKWYGSWRAILIARYICSTKMRRII